MDFLIGIFVGLSVASLLWYCLLKKRMKTIGTFVMDFTDPLKDVCRIELHENLNSLYSKKLVTFRVKVYDDDSLN